jgi:hypothetical protein
VQYNGPLGQRHYIKPRVGVDRMLQSLKGMYDLHLYTMGIRPYADAVVKAMDPNRELFKNVVTRDDCPGSCLHTNWLVLLRYLLWFLEDCVGITLYYCFSHFLVLFVCV